MRYPWKRELHPITLEVFFWRWARVVPLSPTERFDSFLDLLDQEARVGHRPWRKSPEDLSWALLEALRTPDFKANEFGEHLVSTTQEDTETFFQISLNLTYLLTPDELALVSHQIHQVLAVEGYLHWSQHEEYLRHLQLKADAERKRHQLHRKLVKNARRNPPTKPGRPPYGGS